MTLFLSSHLPCVEAIAIRRPQLTTVAVDVGQFFLLSGDVAFGRLRTGLFQPFVPFLNHFAHGSPQQFIFNAFRKNLRTSLISDMVGLDIRAFLPSPASCFHRLSCRILGKAGAI